VADARATIEVVASRLGSRVQRDVEIGEMTTYRVGGRADLFVDVDDEACLDAVTEAVAGSGLPVIIVGNGSNLLVADRGFRGLAVKLGAHFATVVIHETTVVAGGAALLPVVARRTAAAGLTGFEWAVGVPGSIGGAVRMNAGGHGSDMAATLVGVRVVDLRTGDHGVMAVDRLDLGYRRSSLAPEQLVVEATIELERGDVEEAERLIGEIVAWRRANQPGGPNAGSVFTNPADDSAGRLIDAAGLRGLRRGSAEISTKHANFIQCDPGGRASDVLALMVEVRERVADHAGVTLEPETRLVGFDQVERGQVAGPLGTTGGDSAA
jgi:UDP-N-acetylmuramate dehydrogenase